MAACLWPLGSLLLSAASPAGPVETPAGRRDRAEADRLIDAIRLSENSVRQGAGPGFDEGGHREWC